MDWSVVPKPWSREVGVIVYNYYAILTKSTSRASYLGTEESWEKFKMEVHLGRGPLIVYCYL